ncbi:hypothetical protein KFE94_01755 [bacterium SCSIO 12643]|nr:hypothetical protein KFE94_01755 [bacterium SCSIO 12643]
MMKRRVKLISEIKSVEDLNRLKLEKKYEMQLKQLEFKASLIQVQMNLQPESIKETFREEGKSLGQRLAMKYLPAFLLRFMK